MNQLSYDTLAQIGYTGFLQQDAPVRALQFGEGNFLRAFVDFFFDIANEKGNWNGKIAMIQPTPFGRTAPVLNAQDGLYTLYLRGRENGQVVDERRVVSVSDKCYNPYLKEEWDSLKELAASDELEYVISNTTEAGIVFDPGAQAGEEAPTSFPAKLTLLLLERFHAGKKGLVILPCELIDDNGKILRDCVLSHIETWQLGDAFRDWVMNENYFCSTLVDRIVSGKIRDEAEVARLDEENGYKDTLPDVGEVFGAWYIEGPDFLKERLPFGGLDLPVYVVPDVVPYKKRKTRILNGAHTGFVPGAYLAGQNIVRDCMQDDVICGFMNKMLYEEVIPVLPLEKSDCEAFAAAVTDRFNNPFVDHQLLSIGLNSTSKWKTRNMPTLLDYTEKLGKLPEALTCSLAAYIAFYSSNIQGRDRNALVCVRPNGDSYKVQDDEAVLSFYEERKNLGAADLVQDVLSNKAFWGRDLTQIPGLADKTSGYLELIRREGALEAFRKAQEA